MPGRVGPIRFIPLYSQHSNHGAFCWITIPSYALPAWKGSLEDLNLSENSGAPLVGVPCWCWIILHCSYHFNLEANCFHESKWPAKKQKERIH
jgi:hypothetical protein